MNLFQIESSTGRKMFVIAEDEHKAWEKFKAFLQSAEYNYMGSPDNWRFIVELAEYERGIFSGA